ncbi:uncharacterized protein LOC128277727 [Anopheles cruzii]|uniref:uncharacterized protein LOC128277727 n=1 Tax=Anopheles cruzii TaxID=68878 RepID=UPI0022EC4837|nr:uncharacterized protein LOC128277727 [Anopheles cruzii]
MVPACSTALDRATLWPFQDPNFYQRCVPDSAEVQWNLVRQPCHGRRLFHFTRQTCTRPEDWEEACPAEPVEPLPPAPCPEVRCDSIDDTRQLWPDIDPARFYQCIPQATGGIAAVGQLCRFGTLFSVRNQACIVMSRWTAECSFESPTDPTTETEPTTTGSTTLEPPQSTTPDAEWTLCQPPVCGLEDPILYPHTDRTLYYQCVPQPDGFWVPLERPCAAGTHFHYGLQHCVFPADWENFCPV